MFFAEIKMHGKKLLKNTVTILGVLTCFFSLLSCLVSNFNLGFCIQFLFGIVLALWYNVKQNRFVKVVKVLVVIGICFVLGVIAFILVMSDSNKTDFNDDAVIVLGCAVYGTNPTNTLCDRLDRCVEYSKKNPGAIIVVSGGQGPQEDISEAEAMKIYLCAHGVDLNRIYKEDKATSTKENFKYSKELLDGIFDREYSVCYITNDFHTYRAGRYAKMAGFDNPKTCKARTSAQALTPTYLREVAAVLYFWVFGK